VRYNFSTAVNDVDPGAGIFRYNSGAIASVVYIYIDNVDQLGNTQTGWYDTWDDSTTTATRGTVTVYSRDSGSVVNVFQVTGAVIAGVGYYKIPVSYVSGTLPSDGALLAIQFSRTGNSGTSGTAGTTGTSGTSGSSTGTHGTSGTSGVNGTSGTNGATGAAGTSGTTGTSGTSGASGAAGTSGTSGAGTISGTTNTVAKFSSTTAVGNSSITDTGSLVTIGVNTTVNGHLAAQTKAFLIDHPTKEGMKLQYACLEGPENGVYVRGRARGREIRLPDYWVALVDWNSISVQLTPIGSFKELYVEAIDSGSVYVNSNGGNLDYFYIVYAERKDVEKLTVEF
jgi:hypothetical protein